MEAPTIPNPLSTLFEHLGPDPETAGEEYEKLRRKLMKFFEWRGAFPPDQLADKTIDRMAEKVAEKKAVGEEIQNINAYSRSVAYYIYREWLERGHDHKQEPVEDYEHMLPAQNPSNDNHTDEIRLECQRKCLQELPGKSVEIIGEYFMGAGRDRINHRKAMAKRMGISRTALGNRIARLLRKLRECFHQCLKNNGLTDMN